MKIVKKIVKWLGIFLLLLVFGIVLISLVPVPNDSFPANPNPITNHQDAVSRVEEILAEEMPVTNENGHSIFMTTGAKTDEVYVLIHGLTNAPYEFEELGQMLFDQGHNVLILRMPYHGLESMNIHELDPLTAEDIRAYADEVIDIAFGLGEKITVIGISGGGAAAAWITQNRPEVDRVVLLSPFFGLAQTPMFLDPIVKNALLRLPNLAISREQKANRYWMYSGESGNGAAAFMTIGQSTVEKAESTPPAVNKILMLTTASDLAVDNDWVDRLAKEWQANGAAVDTYMFEKSLNIPHASIDPFVEAEKRQLVYDRIFAWLNQGNG